MLMDSSKFFKALGYFARDVTVITGRGPTGESGGVTVNGFPPVFWDPPLILICLAKITGCLRGFSDGERFAAPQEHKFKNREYETGDSGVPILLGSLVNLECTRVAVPVERLENAENGRPLLSHRNAHGRVEHA